VVVIKTYVKAPGFNPLIRSTRTRLLRDTKAAARAVSIIRGKLPVAFMTPDYGFMTMWCQALYFFSPPIGSDRPTRLTRPGGAEEAAGVEAGICHE
jgi:hypothetical protein